MVHEQFENLHEQLLLKVHEVGGNFFAKYHTNIVSSASLLVIPAVNVIQAL